MTRLMLLFLFSVNLCYGQTKKPKPYVVEPEEMYFNNITNAELLQYPLRNAKKDILKYARTVFGKYVVVSNLTTTYNENSKVFYQQEKDTTWIEVDIDYSQVTLDTVNLDKKGKPELILNCRGCSYGSGGGSCTGAVIILNIDSVPVCLFNVKNYCSTETFARMYGDGATTEEESEDFMRPITIKNRMIYISPFKAAERKQWEGQGCEFTEIPGGKYKLQNGKIRRIIKQ